MNNLNKIIQVAITSFFTLTTTLAITQVDAATTDKTEKCYGIVKAGMNDCQTAAASCAGSAKTDNQKDAYLLLPEGTCKKIVGGSLTLNEKPK